MSEDLDWTNTFMFDMYENNTSWPGKVDNLSRLWHAGKDNFHLRMRNSTKLWLADYSGNGSSQYEFNEERNESPRISGGSLCPGLEWHVYLEMTAVPVLTVLGLLGNTLSFLVLFSPVYRRRSYSYYLRALAVFDSLTLIITTVIIFNDIVFKFSDDTIRYLGMHNTLTCKLSEYARHVIYLMSSWLIVCFTVDRYIAVCHPLQRARLCTGSGALVTMVLVFIGVCMSETYILVLIEQVDRDGSIQCHASMENRLLYMGIHYFLFSFSLRFALPFLLIVVFNGLIMYHIKRMKSNGLSREREKKRKANLAIYTLFLVCIVFVITLLPNAVIAMLQFILFRVHQSIALYCPLKMLDSPFKMIRLINYSANFVLYGMTGRQFRCEVRKLLCCQMYIRNFNERMRDVILQGKNHEGNYAIHPLQDRLLSSKPTRKCQLS